MKKKLLMLIVLAAVLTLSACGKQADSDKTSDAGNGSGHSDMGNMESMDMNHSGSGAVPQGLMEAKHPTFKAGDHVVIHADHMEGMNGAQATIDGAYDTIAYAVTYTPTTGGAKAPGHKWVVQQEIKGAGSEPLKPGTAVTLEADHMEGMNGAQATIDSAEKTTVYMVDYTPTTGGEPVKNHKWVVESELSKN
ncbi:YdhK family protein [Paenibacillus humicola]|uniref:YdhK family protein n=1 Tax=Paenibacillus humicola TaxID=3110540 RepID=UPI00237BCF71|nr:YdhK family protein [Paenibacillus humicola]